MNNELLIKLAQDVRTKAYAPYSNFKVGAAVLAESGKVYTGCNVENASYGLTNCAERSAIFKAVSEGEINLRKICIVADSSALTPPCGACRQVLAEFNIQEIVLANLQGDIAKFTLEELLSHSITKNHL